MGGWHERRCLTFCYSDRWGCVLNPRCLSDLLSSCQTRQELQLSGVNVVTAGQICKGKHCSGWKPHLMNNRQKQMWFTEATMIVTLHLSIRKSRSSILLTSSRWLVWKISGGSVILCWGEEKKKRGGRLKSKTPTAPSSLNKPQRKNRQSVLSWVVVSNGCC